MPAPAAFTLPRDATLIWAGTPCFRGRRVAEMLGIAPRTLETWRRYGRGPRWIRVGSKAIVYPLDDLILWVEAINGGAGPVPG